MVQIRFTGWVKGANTVNAIKAIREEANISLKDALDLVNSVLRNEKVDLLVANWTVAESLAAKVRAFGLLVELPEH